MKFKKLIFGLAAAPLLLASCNNAILYDNAAKWVAEHYTISSEETNKRPAITTFYWDFQTTKDTGAADKVLKDVFTALSSKAYQKIGLDPDIIHYPNGKGKVGEEKLVDKDSKIAPLNSNSFGHYGKQDKDGNYKETFKIVDNALAVYSTEDLENVTSAKDQKIEGVSCVYVYNTEGYLAGYGLKIGHYYIDPDNVVKLQVTLEFEYSH